MDLDHLSKAAHICYRSHPEILARLATAAVASVLWVVAWLAATVPLCTMCCCTVDPEAAESAPPTLVAVQDGRAHVLDDGTRTKSEREEAIQALLDDQ